MAKHRVRKAHQMRERTRGRSPRYLSTVLLCALLAFLLPLLAFFAADHLQEAQYGESYYAVLGVKYDRLRAIEGKKIVVVGGSATAFGIDEALVEEETGMPCASFGLYAAFGLKCMLRLSESAVGEGDIVVIMPEYSSQMFSDYVGYDALLQAAEEYPQLLFRLGLSYLPGLYRAYPAYLERKREVAQSGGVHVTGVYARSSFDALGRMQYVRDANVMDLFVSGDNLPELKPEIVTDSFLEMINDYVHRCERRGASVYFGFVPVNRLSVEKAQDADPDGFYEALREGLDCEILSDLDAHIMDERFFYDSNYHMNDIGAVYNSVLLIDDIKRVSGAQSQTKTRLPYPPEITAGDHVTKEGVTDGFAWALTAEGITITGLDEISMQMQKLAVPETIDNVAVRKIDTFAFRGAAAQTITLPESVTVLNGHLFEDCVNLKTVEVLATELPQVGETLMDGAPDDARIAVPDSAFGVYLTDYFWARYSARLSRIE